MKRYYLLLIFSFAFLAMQSQNSLSYTHSDREYPSVDEEGYFSNSEDNAVIMMSDPGGGVEGECTYKDKPAICCEWWKNNEAAFGGGPKEPKPAECPIGGGALSMVLMGLGYAFYRGRRRRA